MNDLGYRCAQAWPIFERKEGRRVMYYMVHATDHDEAPKLMARANAAISKGRSVFDAEGISAAPQPRKTGGDQERGAEDTARASKADDDEAPKL
jgi:hypothetical protein